MSTNPPSFRLPINVRGLVDDKVAEAIENHDDAITDLQQAISPLATQITALKSGTSSSTGTGTTTVENVSTEQITNNFVNNIGFVNNQTGVTSYATQQSDLGKIVVLDDASAIAVALTSAPVITLPWYATFINLGAGTATLTPVSGTISYSGNLGAASLPLSTGQLAIVGFDGTNFWAAVAAFPVVPPQNTPAITHQFLTAFNAISGVFSQAQPAIADVSGLAAALALLAPIASPTFTGTVTQPDAPVLTAATTATSATAGAASALPATPAGYLDISINGTVFKVPYYAV
jgi:hypothetical protein